MSENRQNLEEFHLSASQIFTVFFHWESQPLVTVSKWSVVLSWASEYITSWEVPCIGLLGAFLILFHIFKTSNLPLMNQRLFIKLLKTDQNELFPFLTPFKAAILARISKFSIHYSWVLIMPRNWSSAVISLHGLSPCSPGPHKGFTVLSNAAQHSGLSLSYSLLPASVVYQWNDTSVYHDLRNLPTTTSPPSVIVIHPSASCIYRKGYLCLFCSVKFILNSLMCLEHELWNGRDLLFILASPALRCQGLTWRRQVCRTTGWKLFAGPIHFTMLHSFQTKTS